MAEMVDRVAKVLMDHAAEIDHCVGWDDGSEGWRNTYREHARAAIDAYEAFQAEARRKKAATENIAFLRANIAQCDRFMARGRDADPIGHHQWGERKADFQRELDAALAAADEPDAPAAP